MVGEEGEIFAPAGGAAEELSESGRYTYGVRTPNYEAMRELCEQGDEVDGSRVKEVARNYAAVRVGELTLQGQEAGNEHKKEYQTRIDNWVVAYRRAIKDDVWLVMLGCMGSDISQIVQRTQQSDEDQAEKETLEEFSTLLRKAAGLPVATPK
jgi:hypothetical protein